MLAMKLKPGDRVRIGDGVTIYCRKSGTGAVRIAIDAPGIPIARDTHQEGDQPQIQAVAGQVMG